MACLKRDSKSLNEYGVNQELEWKPDSSAIAVTVSIFYCMGNVYFTNNLY